MMDAATPLTAIVILILESHEVTTIKMKWTNLMLPDATMFNVICNANL